MLKNIFKKICVQQNNSANYENIGGCLKELKNRITEMKAISGNLEGKIRAGRNNQQLLMNWCHLNEVLKKLETFESEFYAHLRLTNDVEEYKSLRAELQRLLSVGVDDEIELDESAVLVIFYEYLSERERKKYYTHLGREMRYGEDTPSAGGSGRCAKGVDEVRRKRLNSEQLIFFCYAFSCQFFHAFISFSFQINFLRYLLT